MIIKVLASGSKGTCNYLNCNNTNVLIDCGLSYIETKNKLNEINIDIENIDYILLTHTHTDHTKGLQTILNKTKAVLVITEELLKTVDQKIDIQNYLIINDDYAFEEFNLKLIHMSHDVLSYGFLIESKGVELVYITDTGYINRKYFKLLSNKDIYIVESNHDEKMLMDGPYPRILKERIISDKGHLSNNATGKFLSNVAGSNTKFIILAHISEHNNDKKLALDTNKEYLKEIGFNVENILIADQYIALENIEV